jgi:hypothetical protein
MNMGNEFNCNVGGARSSTANGDIFLGHSDPERIVRDRDRIMSN